MNPSKEDSIPDMIPTMEDIDPETGTHYTKSRIKKIEKILKAKKQKEVKRVVALEKKKEEGKIQENVVEERYEVIKEDKSLPEAVRIKTAEAEKYLNKRVKVYGWADKLRTQGGIMFVLLRDSSSLKNRLQCVLEGKLTKTKEAAELVRECSLVIYGTLFEDKRAEGSIELKADYWELIGNSSGEFSSIVDEKRDLNVTHMMDNKHLFLRKRINMQIFTMRSAIVQCFRNELFEMSFTEVTPPTLVETMVEGGSTLFTVDYFGKPVYLTQSSQLYLETCIFFLGNAFCIVSSYRAEKTRTRRHLTEYTHLESEMPFICFDDMLKHLEDLIVSVCEKVVEKKGDLLSILNPNFKVPKKPFIRMNYSEAINYCRAHEIYKDEETKEHFKYGDEIPEGPERKMTDMIGEPIFLCRFPAEMKPFYMKKCEDNEELTESVDLLIPGVGEVVGGSMREMDHEKLMLGFKEKGVDPKNYYWYTDLRKYGTIPHGGYGLGIERFLCWILKRDHIRDVCLYPRFTNRCFP